MPTLRETRTRISAVRNTSKITQAMQMVAAAKLRRAQDGVLSARPYFTQITGILANLAAAETDFVHPFFEQRKHVRAVTIIAVSSDRGLCGAFNANVIRATVQRVQEIRANDPECAITVIPVGRRIVLAFRKRAEAIAKEYPDVFAKLEFTTAAEIAESVSDSFLNGTTDRVEVICNEFVSIIRQEVRTSQLLPILPVKREGAAHHPVDYIFEPTRADILDSLLPRYTQVMVWKALLESNAAEQAARMMAMDNATSNAKELLTNLQLIYNRARQAAITKEMLEIVGGAEALSSN